jgi:hypothetical protein
MRKQLYEIRQSLDRTIWWPLAQFANVTHPVPLLAGLAIFYLLAHVGQMHEIYLVYLQPPYDQLRLIHIVLAAGALGLLSAALYYANYALSNVTIEIVWAECNDLESDNRLRAWRNISGGLIAALPWAGVLWGVWSAGAKASSNIRTLNQTARNVEGLHREAEAALSALQDASSGLAWALIIAVLGCFLAVIFLHRFRRSSRIVFSALGLVALLFLAAILVPTLMHDASGVERGVQIFRMIGPLAMIVFDLLLVFGCVIVLTMLSRKEAFSILILVLAGALVAVTAALDINGVTRLLIALFAVVFVLALFSKRWPLAALSFIICWLAWGATPSGQSGTLDWAAESTKDHVRQRYLDWLADRETARAEYQVACKRDSADARCPYPVFIIAAEGGGIFAAAAASAFLSQLQDRCPSFAQHVFAISAVSGGAVGAAVFQSQVRDRHLQPTGCLDRPVDLLAPTSASAKSAAIIQDDHLSPILGFFVPDMLGKYDDRAKGLEQSLVNSVRSPRTESGAASNQAARPARSLLDDTFDDHWSTNRAAPALVLNSTWVETGYRVAFAPFRLRGVGSNTLYSFSDFDNGKVSLATAAVVSARFPAIVPAFMINGKDRRWNLVDGGYKDSSGASTALDILNEIEPLGGNDVKVRLILLTSARLKFTPKEVKGTRTRDTLAPLQALLNVRDRLAEDAVTRAMGVVDKDSASGLQERSGLVQRGVQSGREDDWKVTLFEIDERGFSLSLGWKISKSTHEIVSLQMGRPELCTDANIASMHPPKPPPTFSPPGSEGERSDLAVASKAAADKPEISVPTLLANSCFMRSVMRIIDPNFQKVQRPGRTTQRAPTQGPPPAQAK